MLLNAKSSDKGKRLDVFVTENHPYLSRAKAREACKSDKVRVNGKIQRPGYLLSQGDSVEISDDLKLVRARPELVPDNQQGIEVVYEDESLLVIAKPRSIHSIVLRIDDPLTVADYIAKYCPSCAEASEDKREAGLVQRLDYFTSGLMIAAKNKIVWEKLKAAMKQNEISKSYLALVEGLGVTKQLVSNRLTPSSDGKKMLVASEGVEAQSLLNPVSEDTSKLQSVVRVEGRSMRRHQVRLHLSEVNHPLLGDHLYGATRELPDDEQGFLLHAEQISFVHPMTNQQVKFETRKILSDKLCRLLYPA